ncbi:hypothetical protein [Acidipropionibacterium virtanenii]|uniref:Uncharacterized protein n=1 Tax=Acidipropionibacterium virtanenii TaxID=2057246 RepID=A0A344UPV5_9ACTN|nr:hypothetical protein [Acidipropionibacterium virtanenii]AXE37303.1 hypothetical protein JS278_00106 [Acidipropionibacterium virtanenii]
MATLQRSRTYATVLPRPGVLKLDALDGRQRSLDKRSGKPQN